MVNVTGDKTGTISQHSPIKLQTYASNQNSYEPQQQRLQQPQPQIISHTNIEPRVFVKSFGRKGQNFGEFNGVFAVAVDTRQRRIVATDYNNHRVQVFDEQGKFLFLFGERGMADGQFQSPTGIGVGPGGEIIVCERLKGRIQVGNITYRCSDAACESLRYSELFKR